MRFLRRLKSFGLLGASMWLAWLSSHVIQKLDPNAGAFDIGYLQRPVMAASYFFFLMFCVLVCFQIEFPTIDKWVHHEDYRLEFRSLPSLQKFVILFGVLLVLLTTFMFCLKCVPV